jgi:tetratricopeptide (TPR) repeat protein
VSALPTDAASWLARGQELEARENPAALTEALRCYDLAIALLRAAPRDPAASTPHTLATAWMNRGNALHQLGTPTDLTSAIAAYDETIRLLREAPAAELSARNTLGAAWMNRGLAAHRQGTPASILEAVRSHAEAIAVLSALPLKENPVFRRNLSAALLNQANALLDTHKPELLESALAAARSALELVADSETTALESADLSFKTRRVLCDALGLLLTVHESARLPLEPLTAEASDNVDDALALARHWEVQGVLYFRPVAARLFRFGTQLYRFNQPHFLAEFILENLDPEKSAGALPVDGDFGIIATEAITRSLETLRSQPGIVTASSENDRRLQTWRDLKAAQLRLAALGHVTPPSAERSA